MGVWSIVLHQNFLKVIPKTTPGPHSHGSHGNMKQGAIFGVTEPILNMALVVIEQLKNGTVPIMPW